MYYYTGFRLYSLRIYGLFGFISVIWIYGHFGYRVNFTRTKPWTIFPKLGVYGLGIISLCHKIILQYEIHYC